MKAGTLRQMTDVEAAFEVTCCSQVPSSTVILKWHLFGRCFLPGLAAAAGYHADTLRTLGHPCQEFHYGGSPS